MIVLGIGIVCLVLALAAAVAAWRWERAGHARLVEARLTLRAAQGQRAESQALLDRVRGVHAEMDRQIADDRARLGEWTA